MAETECDLYYREDDFSDNPDETLRGKFKTFNSQDVVDNNKFFHMCLTSASYSENAAEGQYRRAFADPEPMFGPKLNGLEEREFRQ